MPNMSSIPGWIHRHLNRIGGVVGRLGRQILLTWRTHRDRLSNDPAYGGALVGVVVAACQLITRDPRVIAVVAAVSTAYVAISLAIRRPHWNVGNDWDAGDDWWRPDPHVT